MARRYGNYIEGSAARNIAQPRRRYEEPVRREQRRQVRKPLRNTLSMNGAYVAFLAIAAIACVVVCVMYIRVQADISQKTAHINSLKNEISVLGAQNDSLDYTVNGFVDVDYVCKVAKEELGMIEASGEQVVIYDKTDSEYMKQLEDVPNK